ncbi:hypothetical protein GCM10010172_69910 [Paractinoplanes ferrugineus]|nr:hypothetical protein [Actinoplanes ferrugineus]
MRAIVAVIYPNLTAGDPGLVDDERGLAEVGTNVIDGVVITRADVLAGPRFPQATGTDNAIFGTVDGVVPGFVQAEVGEQDTDLAAAGRALAADGWRTGAADSRSVTAARDGWRLRLDNGGDFSYGDHDKPVSTLRVERRPTDAAVAVAALGWLLGCVAGWFKPDRVSIGHTGPALLTINTVIAAVGVLRGVVAIFGTGSFPVPWAAFELFLVRPLTLIGLLMTAAYLVTTRRFHEAMNRRAKALRGR